MDDLAPVINHIAEIASKTEVNRWELAEAIHTAFSELPAYEHGLLSGLCEKLKYTTAQVYNYRNAWDIKQECYLVSGSTLELSVSHCAKMAQLADRFLLPWKDTAEYLELAETENWSVRQLAQEVERNHEPDPEGQYKKSIKRFTTLGRKILNDPQNKMAKPLYANLYDLIKEMETL